LKGQKKEVKEWFSKSRLAEESAHTKVVICPSEKSAH
jgi:hypothetical protein